MFCADGGGGEVPAWARACVSTIHQMGTVDVEILSTQRLQARSLIRNDVHLEYFMHLIILATGTIGLCCFVSCYVCLLIALDAPPASFSFGGVSLLGGSKVVGVQKDSLQKKVDNLGLGGLRVAGKIIIVRKHVRHILC